MLGTQPVGRSLVYFVDERSPLVPELRGLVQKTIGVPALLREALELSGERAARCCPYLNHCLDSLAQIGSSKVRPKAATTLLRR